MAKVTRKFSKAFMLTVIGYGWSKNHDEDAKANAKLMSDVLSDHSRWSVGHDVIFEYGGKFYSSWYSVGATEWRTLSPWEYGGDEIECVEVRPVERVVTVYEEVDA